MSDYKIDSRIFEEVSDVVYWLLFEAHKISMGSLYVSASVFEKMKKKVAEKATLYIGYKEGVESVFDNINNDCVLRFKKEGDEYMFNVYYIKHIWQVEGKLDVYEKVMECL